MSSYCRAFDSLQPIPLGMLSTLQPPKNAIPSLTGTQRGVRDPVIASRPWCFHQLDGHMYRYIGFPNPSEPKQIMPVGQRQPPLPKSHMPCNQTTANLALVRRATSSAHAVRGSPRTSQLRHRARLRTARDVIWCLFKSGEVCGLIGSLGNTWAVFHHASRSLPRPRRLPLDGRTGGVGWPLKEKE